MDAALQFDVEQHTYRLDGAEVPSVTDVLRPIAEREYRAVPAETLAAAAWLGQAAHKLIELDIAGVLDEASLDPSLAPYLRQWREFRATSGFVPLLSETQVYSRRYGYAGTLDLFGTLHGEAALIDAKRCARVPRTAGPQTAAYEIALRECRPEVVELAASGPSPGRVHRFALHLTPDRWRLVPLTNPNDARVFLAALTLRNFEREAA